MKEFYFLLDGDVIIDAIEYNAPGYTRVVLNQTHLPAGINAGWYRWDGAAYTLDEQLRAQSIDGIIQKARQEAQDELLLDLLEREAI